MVKQSVEKLIKSIVTYTFATIGAVASILFIFGWLQAPSSKLSAEMTYCDFLIPTGLKDTLYAQHDLSDIALLDKELKLSNNLSMIKDSSLLKEVNDQALRSVSLFIEHNLPHNIPPPYSFITGCWFASISNDGDLTLDSVNIWIPATMCILLIKADGSKIHRLSGGSIEIGSLRPTEKVELAAWTSSYYPSTIKLIYKSGIGSVTFRQYVGEFWRNYTDEAGSNPAD